MDLKTWLSKKGLSQAAFGQQLDPPATQGLVSQWINGDTAMTLARAVEIEKLTAGKVTVYDCLRMRTGQAAAPAPR